ncbi:MAG: YraN family protein [Muribaculaceae bacterium]|nr:YraN family protein [Muribaculaceae bacterium]
MDSQMAKKLRDLEFGKFAENKAVEYYESKGYLIRARNWRFKKIEIDVIAQIGSEIVFIEVIARSGRNTAPVDAVNFAKRRRMVYGADIYLRRLNGNYEYRYDIFALEGDMSNYRIEVYENAFYSPLM